MKVCPVCGWPLASTRQIKTHMGIEHADVKFVTVLPSDGKFEMSVHDTYPDGDWLKIGNFWRTNDNQPFIALGQGLYAGEVDADQLGAHIADFLGLGKRVL